MAARVASGVQVGHAWPGLVADARGHDGRVLADRIRDAAQACMRLTAQRRISATQASENQRNWTKPVIGIGKMRNGRRSARFMQIAFFELATSFPPARE